MSPATDSQASARRAGKSATAFRTISEAADELDLPQHVLRFWESKFPQIRPMKRGGGRRYYRPEDMDILRRIRALLYEDGYTIKGVQKLLRVPHARAPRDEGGDPPASAPEPPEPAVQAPAEAKVEPVPGAPLGTAERQVLREILDELEAIRRLL